MNIRKKSKWKTGESKFVIEDKGKYVETLPPINILIKLLRPENTSCPIREEKPEIEKKPSKTSHNLHLSEPPKQDVNNTECIMQPSTTEGNRAYEGVIWQCNKCGFKTGLLFEDKHCPECRQHEQLRNAADRIMNEVLEKKK